jgi:tetratricopeptide (TPR) repeat protein
LIQTLISNGDLYNAERYAEITYGNLRDKKNGIDQNSDNMALGAYNLANVIYQQNGNFTKSEELAREALRITILVHGSDNFALGMHYQFLARILIAQGTLGDETEELYSHSLEIYNKIEGPDAANTELINIGIGMFYCKVADIQSTVDLKRRQLILAKSYLRKDCEFS